MKRLLIVNTNFPPSTSIGTQRIIRISKYLDDSKWNIFVLTLKEKYYEKHADTRPPMAESSIYRTGKMDPLFFLLKLKARLRGNGKAAASNGKPASPPSAKAAQKASAPKSPATTAGPSRWQRIKDGFTGLFEFPDKDITWLPLAVWRGWRIIRRHKIDVIYSSSPPHSLHISAAVLKVLTGCKLVVDFRDPWARSPWHEEQIRKSPAEKRKFERLQRLEKWVVKKADQVVFVTPEMQQDFLKYYTWEPPEKFKLFFNGYDPDNIKTPDQNGRQVAETENSDRQLTFVHTGTLYKRRDPTQILKAIRLLLDKKAISPGQIKLQFIGNVTSELKHVPAMVAEMNIGDIVEFVPPVSYAESFEYMQNSDILILLQPYTQLQIPGKFYDYICFEKPILAVGEKDSAVENLVKDRFGIFADYHDVDDIQEAILQCISSGFDTDRIRENRQYFDMSKSVKIFEEIIDN